MQKRDLLGGERERGSRCPSGVTMTISPGSMSRTKRAPMMSSAQVSEARIGGAVEIAEDQRPDAERIAAADHLLGRQADQRPGALDLAERVDDPVDQPAARGWWR